MIQRRASAWRRSWRISTGTWYVAPPTRFGLTSSIGVTFRIAWSKTSSGSLREERRIFSNES
jgi:hypothetical protein